MGYVKRIWRDNTMPPTNYIWMKTNLKNELIGIYEWVEGKWREIHIGGDSDTYTKSEVDLLIQLTEDEIVRKLAAGEYEIGNIVIDSDLSSASNNPVENRVVTKALNKKLDKVDYVVDTPIPLEYINEIFE